jgi:hypothetical protein
MAAFQICREADGELTMSGIAIVEPAFEDAGVAQQSEIDMHNKQEA